MSAARKRSHKQTDDEDAVPVKSEPNAKLPRDNDDGDDEDVEDGAAAAAGMDEDAPLLLAELPAADAEGWRHGAIVRVTMHNFVTYNHAELRAGPRLNVIIGPNGSGKSTVVSALAVGLGSKLQVLDRESEIGRFVMQGRQTGWVELELFRPPRNVVVRRTISIDNSSEWQLDGKRATEKRVREVVRDLHIQIDNLCQFMPQERVGELAALTPQKLLIETERAIGKNNLLADHNRLIELRKALRENEVSDRESRARLDNIRRLNANLERDVLRFKQREVALKRKKELQEKLPWMQFEAERVKGAEVQDRLAIAEVEMKKADAELKPLRTAAQRAKAQIERLSRERREIDTRVSHMTTAYNSNNDDLAQKLTKCITDYERKARQLEQSAKEASDRLRRLRHEQAQLDRLVARQTALKTQAEGERDKQRLLDRIDVIDKEAQEEREHLTSLQQQAGEKRTEIHALENEMRRASSWRDQQLNKLRARHQSVLFAYEWLQRNTATLQGKWFGPGLIEVKPANANAAMWLEKVVSREAPFMFVFTQHADVLKFRRAMDSAGRLEHLSYSEFDSYSPPPRPLSAAEIRNSGIQGFLSELIEAPDEVRAIMDDGIGASLSTVACSATEPTQRQHDLLASGRLVQILAPEAAHRATKRRDGEFAFYSEICYPAKWFSILQVNKEQVAEAEANKARLESELEQLVKQIEDVRKHISDFEKQMQPLQQELQREKTVEMERREIARQITRKQADIEIIEAEEDVSALQARLKRELAECAQQRVKLLEQRRERLRDRMRLIAESTAAMLRLQEERRTYEPMLMRVELLETTYADKKDVVDVLKPERDRIREVVKRLKLAAERVAPIQIIANMTEEQKKDVEDRFARFQTLPNTLADLEREIEDADREARLVGSVREDVMVQYEERLAEIKRLEAAAETREQELEQKRADLKEVRERWEQNLRPVVEALSQQFQSYMAKIQCAGQIDLEIDDEDYARSKLRLLVSFRSGGGLQQLEAEKQSGGEKSVSTMLFLLSLQTHSPVPFRLVDEINQGMDPTNERNIWSEIVASFDSPDLPQYFLITPKLLPGLRFTRGMVVHCVFNGPRALSQQQWDQSHGMRGHSANRPAAAAAAAAAAE